MSENPDDERLQEIREEKMEELRERQSQEGAEAAEAQRQEAEAQKKAILRQHLTDGARQRLNTVQMSKPEFGERVEQQVIALAQSGRLQDRIDEDQMKELLQELKPDSKDFNIRRR